MEIDGATTYVLLDESGNGTEPSPLLVGAVKFTDLAATEAAIANLYALHRESTRLEGLESFEVFVSEGFHYATNPRETQGIFINFLARLPGYRGFFATSNGSRMSGLTSRQRALVLYGTILPDVILSSTTPRLVLAFEVNDDLRRSFPKLVADATARAQAKAPHRTLPEVGFITVGKKDPHAMAVTDYVMAILSHWFQSGLPTDPRKYEFRDYRAVVRNIALIYDFDSGRRSDRARRTFH